MNASKKALITFIAFGFFIGCSPNPNSQKESQTMPDTLPDTLQCIDYIIQQDDSLGKVRNETCKKKPLSESIKNYVAEVRQLNFNTCPEDFHLAFMEHMNAWEDILEITNKYDDLRGEMHELFDSLRVSHDSVQFIQYEQKIWETWTPVEEFLE